MDQPCQSSQSEFRWNASRFNIDIADQAPLDAEERSASAEDEIIVDVPIKEERNNQTTSVTIR